VSPLTTFFELFVPRVLPSLLVGAVAGQAAWWCVRRWARAWTPARWVGDAAGGAALVAWVLFRRQSALAFSVALVVALLARWVRAPGPWGAPARPLPGCAGLRWLALALPCLALAGWCLRDAAFGSARLAEQDAIAADMGVDPRARPSWYQTFPVADIRRAIVAHTTTRAEVQGLARHARARYRCPCGAGRAPGSECEKYVFLSSDPWYAQVLNVTCDGRGVVSEARPPGDSQWELDPPEAQGCTRL